MKIIFLPLFAVIVALGPQRGEPIKKGDIVIAPAEVKKITKIYKLEDGFGDDAARVLRTFLGHWKVFGLGSRSDWKFTNGSGDLTISSGKNGQLFIEGKMSGKVAKNDKSGYLWAVDLPRTLLVPNPDEAGRIKRSFEVPCTFLRSSIGTRGQPDERDDFIWRHVIATFWIEDKHLKNILTIEAPKPESAEFVLSGSP